MDSSRLLAMDGRKPIKKLKRRPRNVKRASGPDGKNEGMTGLIHGSNPPSRSQSWRGKLNFGCLAFLNLQTILEKEHVWCDSILTEVKETNYTVRVHGFASEKLKVFDVS